MNGIKEWEQRTGDTLPRGCSVLIVLFGRIGDVLFTLPSVIALKKRRPDISIDWVVEDRCSSLILGHPSLRSVLVFRRGDFEREFRHRRFRPAFRILRDFLSSVRRERYAAVLDFQGLLKSGVVSFLGRGRIKLGSPSTYGRMKEGAGLFSRQVPLKDPSMHLVERHLSVMSTVMGEDLSPSPVFFAFSEEERKRVDSLLGNEPFLLLHPFASWETRNWPGHSWVELVGRLHGEGFRIVLAGGGGSEQESLLVALQAVTGGALDSLLGKLSLRELALVMSRAEAVVAVDSGPMHLASAMNAPVVALFGPTDPVRLGPYGPTGRTGRVVTAGLPCQPCMMRRCPIGTPCQTLLTPDMVLAGLYDLLAREEQAAPDSSVGVSP